MLGIPTIGFGVGVESMAHQVDEHVTLDSLRAGARGYAALARHRAARPESETPGPMRRPPGDPPHFGWEHIPKSISVHGADPSVRLRGPVPGVLREVDGGWFLLDTGFNTPHRSRDRALVAAATHSREDELVGLEGDAVEVAFDFVGVDPADVVAVAVSHLHYDHAGGIRWFAGTPRSTASNGSSKRARPQTAPEETRRSASTSTTRASTGASPTATSSWRRASPRSPTYGHTTGTRASWSTSADGGGFVFAFDAADLQENLDDESAPGYSSTTTRRRPSSRSGA